MRRPPLAMIALLVFALALVACRREDTRTPDGRLVIDYWEKWEGFEKEAMGAVVEKYNASQDKVFVRYTSQSQIDRKLLLATAGGNPPDVAGFFSHTVVSYAEKGALLPLDNLMKRDGIREEDYVPSIINGCKYQGFVWGMPSTPATVTLHYNKRLFREAGLDPERPPQTIAELDEYARKLTKRDTDGKITQLGFSPSDPGWWSPMWAYFFSADLVTADGASSSRRSPRRSPPSSGWTATRMTSGGRRCAASRRARDPSPPRTTSSSRRSSRCSSRASGWRASSRSTTRTWSGAPRRSRRWPRGATAPAS